MTKIRLAALLAFTLLTAGCPDTPMVIPNLDGGNDSGTGGGGYDGGHGDSGYDGGTDGGVDGGGPACPYPSTTQSTRVYSYEPFGDQACGPYYSAPAAANARLSRTPIIAVGPAMYSRGMACGRCLRITGPTGAVVARIADVDPTASGLNLSLETAGFTAITGRAAGIADITFQAVSCPLDEGLVVHVHDSTNDYAVRLYVMNPAHPLEEVALRVDGFFVPMTRTEYGAYTWSSPGAAAAPAPYRLRLTDIFGETLDVTVATVPGGWALLDEQLYSCR